MKQIKPLFFSSFLFFSLVSCKPSEKIETITVPSIYSGGGNIRVIGSDFISPFNTSIQATLYYYDKDYTAEELKDIKETIENDFLYYHALSDRHYSYHYQNEEKNIINLKTINDSYATGEEIELDPSLYQLLKESYEFSLTSDGKFNIFLGTLNDIYETKLESLTDSSKKSVSDAVLEFSSNRYFSTFTSEEREKIKQVKDSIPQTAEEMKDLLTFNEEKKSVIFHSYSKANELKLSLGGNAKGFATEMVARKLKEKYPNISLLINSGFSSLKAIGERPDKKDWKIRYDNPVYYEALMPSKENYYKNEVKIEVNGPFSLSTSGYYQQYFYEKEEGKDEFLRRMHILNPKTGYSSSFFDQTSVLTDDAFYADMITTSLMNTDGKEDALSLFEKIKNHYQMDASLLLCYKVKKGWEEHYSYSIKDYDQLSACSLPISLLKDGRTYQGDYTDLTFSDIKEIKSKFQPTFEEEYLVSSDIYSKTSLLKDSEMKERGKKRIAKIVKID